MAACKRALADASTTEHKSQDPTQTEPPTAPLNSKSGFILKLSLLLLGPYLYLIFHHYKIDRDLKKSILVNAGVSLAGFFVTRKMIPVASKYVLRRNLFGYDINKRGTYGGTLRYCEIVAGLSHWVLLLELSSWSWPSYFSIITSHPIPIGLLSTMQLWHSSAS